jgi:hypothetical protein
MAKSPEKPTKEPEIELHPDAWERFGEFVKRIARAGPQHRTKRPKESPGAGGVPRSEKESDGRD